MGKESEGGWVRTAVRNWERSFCTLETWLWGQGLRIKRQTMRTTVKNPVWDQTAPPNVFVCNSNLLWIRETSPPPPPPVFKARGNFQNVINDAQKANGKLPRKLDCPWACFPKGGSRSLAHPRECPSSLLPTRTLKDQKRRHAWGTPG